ncbi:MAG: hypothetical protein KA217_11335 [Gammaproteobacteria bacterium]|nr:hypothetical protein [Gammaproteobacteria bacterium]
MTGHPRIAALFPPEPRHIPGERWANIALRAAPLVGVAGMTGGFLLVHDPAQWLPYWHLTAATGLAMAVLLASSRDRRLYFHRVTEMAFLP